MTTGITIHSGVTFGAGITIGSTGPSLKLSLDAAGLTTGPWIDTVGGRSFTLNGGVTHSSDGGGSFVFDPSSSQYAQCTSSLPNLSTWTVEAWHYYTNNNIGVAPCIVTEVFPGVTSNINYTLGTDASGGGNNHLIAGYFDPGMWETTTYTTLTAGYWYQIIGTFDGTDVKLYVNNNLIDSASQPGTPISSQAGINLMKRWDNNDFWGGKLAIVKIYDGDIGASGVTSSWLDNYSRFGYASFTMNSADITYNRELYSGYSAATSAGFTSDGSDTWNGIVYNTNTGLTSDIATAWTAAGMDVNNAYVWNVAFATGGSILARVAINPSGTNTIGISPIDQSNTSWQSGSLGGPTLAGTFTFPATFTPYAPITQMSSHNDWC